MMSRAPALSWGALIAAAFAAAFGPLSVQLVFAVVAIGVIGMAHGASDLAIVSRERRPAFLTFYLTTSVACLLWWTWMPGIALPAFLAASAVHFGLEDAPDGSIIERTARGAGLVAGPAILHTSGLSNLLGFAGLSSEWLPSFVRSLTFIGSAAVAIVLGYALHRRDLRLLGGTLAVLTLPPLIGFSVGFLLLHALPQTSIRRGRLECETMTAYVIATLPVLMLAIATMGAVGALLLHFDPTGTRGLFASVAALAVPHLLVTPWFDRPAVRYVRRSAYAEGSDAVLRNIGTSVRPAIS